MKSLRRRVAVREKVKITEEKLHDACQVAKRLHEDLRCSGDELEKVHTMARRILSEAEESKPIEVDKVVEYAHKLAYSYPRPEVIQMKSGVLFQHGDAPVAASSDTPDAAVGIKRKVSHSLEETPGKRRRRSSVGSDEGVLLPSRSWKPGQKKA